LNTSHTQNTLDYDIIINYCYHIVYIVFLFYLYHYLLIVVWRQANLYENHPHCPHNMYSFSIGRYFFVISRPIIYYYITTLCITFSCFEIFFYPIQIILFLDNSRIKLDWKRFRNHGIYVIQNSYLFIIFLFVIIDWANSTYLPMIFYF